LVRRSGGELHQVRDQGIGGGGGQPGLGVAAVGWPGGPQRFRHRAVERRVVRRGLGVQGDPHQRCPITS
jgi:hypothetical protein